jgi:hypothetical protein
MSESSLQEELSQIPDIDWETLLATESGPYGLTETGYLPKPYGRILAEGLALAKQLFGPDVDVNRGSVIRKLIEMSSLEHARTYALLAGVVNNLTIPTAQGDALSRLGEELGLPRPFLTAKGRVKLVFKGDSAASVTLPAGTRMLTAGGHHVALTESAKFTAQRKEATPAAEAYHPGPEHNLDPAVPEQTINRWNTEDPAVDVLRQIAAAMGSDKTREDVCEIKHETVFTGGEMRWPDDRYRQMLLRVPRSIWTVGAMQLAVSLVPGVRQVKLVDLQGGLDIDLPIFGTFNFGERVFGTERDLASPYYFTVLVAPTLAAVWDGPDGLAALVAETIEDLRPIGVFPEIREAAEINVGVLAEIVVDGVPMPAGDRGSVNASAAGQALKRRIASRIQGYIDGLGFGESVSPAKITWAILSETGVADVRNLRLIRYPKSSTSLDFDNRVEEGAVEILGPGESLPTEQDQVAVYVDELDDLVIV